MSEQQQPDGTTKLTDPQDVFNYDTQIQTNDKLTSVQKYMALQALRTSGTVLDPAHLPPPPNFQFRNSMRTKTIDGVKTVASDGNNTDQVGATTMNLDPSELSPDHPLVKSIIQQESGGDNTKVNPSTGAAGLMQIMPANFKPYGVSDPHNDSQNVNAGIRILSEGLNAFHGDVELALASYNYGIGNLRKAMTANHATTFAEVAPHLPAETRNYVPKVMARLRQNPESEVA
jgi:hypothetical protein